MLKILAFSIFDGGPGGGIKFSWVQHESTSDRVVDEEQQWGNIDHEKKHSGIESSETVHITVKKICVIPERNLGSLILFAT